MEVYANPTTQTVQPREQPASGISQGGQLLLLSMRQWVLMKGSQQSISQTLSPTYNRLRCPTAAIDPLNEFMSLLALAAIRPIEIRCHCSKTLSADELSLLKSLRAIQLDDQDRASKELSTMLTGSLERSFQRTAGIYVETLRTAGLSLTGVRHLSVVPARDKEQS